MATIESRDDDKYLRRALLCLSGFIGVGAYWGAIMMFVDPSGAILGLDAVLPHMQVLPLADVVFTNFLFSGIMLALVNGVGNTIAFVGLMQKRHYGTLFAIFSGVALLCWLGVQWAIFEVNALTLIYTILGVFEMILALRLRITK